MPHDYYSGSTLLMPGSKTELTPGSKSFDYELKVIGVDNSGKDIEIDNSKKITMSLVANLAVVNALTKRNARENLIDYSTGGILVDNATVGDLLATLCLLETTLPAFEISSKSSGSYSKICS